MLLLLIRLEKVTKPSLKGLDSTNPQSDILRANGGKFNTTVTLPKSVSPTKITPKARRLIVCKVAMEPRVTSKQLKAFLTLANVNVHEFIIRRTLNNQGVHDRSFKNKATALQK